MVVSATAGTHLVLVRRGSEMRGRIWLPGRVFIAAGRRVRLMLPVRAATGIGRDFARGSGLRMFLAPIRATAGIGVDFGRRICRRRSSRRRCGTGRRQRRYWIDGARRAAEGTGNRRQRSTDTETVVEVT